MTGDSTDPAIRPRGITYRRTARHVVDARSGGARLMTSHEVAERLCMSHEWLRKKVQRREVPFVRLGRYVRFTEAHLAEIIESATHSIPSSQVRSSARTKL
jgi:excisionase family DNA binding protein